MNVRIARIDAAIVRHLAAHPDAADSALGVQHWWLMSLDFEPSSEEVLIALQRLVDERALRKELVGGGTELYSLHRADDDEASMKGT